MSVKEVVKNEIDRLPEDILVEVFDFIKFLETKKERDLLVKNSQELSMKSFEKIWDNEEDAVYDNLWTGWCYSCPIPFSDQTTTKKRPAVIISSNTYNNVSSDIIIMAITSQTEKIIGIGECLIGDYILPVCSSHLL